VMPGETYTVVVGGGGADTATSVTYHGGQGAVRLVWGDGSYFPDTNVS
jgi:hypothetical protein